MPKIPNQNNGRVYLGIDPGMNGGLVCIFSGQATVVPMPGTERDTWDWFAQCSLESGGQCRAVIEKVHSMPQQGVASTFKFGVGYGGLRMALIAAGIPFEESTPQAWMKALGIPARKKNEKGNQWKDRLRAKAQQLFPELECWRWKVGEQRKVSDAILIAEFTRRKVEGRL